MTEQYGPRGGYQYREPAGKSPWEKDESMNVKDDPYLNLWVILILFYEGSAGGTKPVLITNEDVKTFIPPDVDFPEVIREGQGLFWGANETLTETKGTCLMVVLTGMGTSLGRLLVSTRESHEPSES